MVYDAGKGNSSLLRSGINDWPLRSQTSPAYIDDNAPDNLLKSEVADNKLTRALCLVSTGKLSPSGMQFATYLGTICDRALKFARYSRALTPPFRRGDSIKAALKEGTRDYADEVSFIENGVASLS